jgi:glycerol-1-phosphate dehydrogenase [NAD(P)+]
MDGFKQTVPCTAPRVVAADTSVIAGAPAYLSSSGFGDLASKIIAGTDWIIAEKAGALGAPEAPPIEPRAWAMTQNGLMDALYRSVEAGRGDPDAVGVLFQSLAITGFAMQYMKNSRPVSGSEHLFSHVWEMEDLSVDGVPVTHGRKVTIGTLAAAAFTEIFFADPLGPPKAPPSWKRPGPEERKAEVSAAFTGNRAGDRISATALEKYLDGKKAEEINQAFRDGWKDIRDRVLEKLLPYGKLKELLAKAGCPLVPETIGLSREDAIATARKAQMIRNKYTILDLAWDMGVYETILSRLEDSGEYLH